MTPLYDKVMIETAPHKDQSAGGIYIPETAQHTESNIGTVVAVGRGKRLRNGEFAPPCVAVGDRVLFGKYAGTDVTYQEKEYRLIREEDLLAVLTEDEAA